jgi:hypothetical protein
MPTGRAWPAVAFGPNGELYVAGGYNASGYLKSASVFNTATQTWARGPKLPFAEYQQAAVETGAGIVVLGGCGESTCPSDQAILYPVSS